MLKQQTKLRVRLYARLSKDDGDADKESNSITNQLQMLRYNAKEKGFEVIGEYVDDGYSGTTFNRPDLNRIGNVGIIFVCGGGGIIDLSEEGGGFLCLLGPHTCVGIGAFCMKEIGCRHEELHGAAALDENDFIIFTEMHQLMKVRFRFIQHILEFIGTVGNFRDAHTGIPKIGQILLEFFQYLQRHRGWACIKVVYSFHFFPPEIEKEKTSYGTSFSFLAVPPNLAERTWR